MLKRLALKLFTLFVLVIALTTVASAPASATNSRAYCYEMPISESCSSGYWCCDRWGNCMCA
jgi:hypothetical protein